LYGRQVPLPLHHTVPSLYEWSVPYTILDIQGLQSDWPLLKRAESDWQATVSLGCPRCHTLPIRHVELVYFCQYWQLSKLK
jgi:hypothetical protein